MKTKILKQIITFNASPKEIYEILMDSRKHSNFTGTKAVISRKVGGKFSVFNDGLIGINLELKPNEKIVQTWRESRWPKNYFSKVEFNLKKHKNKTVLNFTHYGVPEKNFEEIKEGWYTYYWKPIKRLLN